jgi:hypothetical protein
MPNRGQIQDQGQGKGEAQRREVRGNPRDLPEDEGAQIESDDAAEADGEDDVTGVSQ